MLGKIGYGTFNETLASKKAIIFVRRDHFNEEPFLRRMLELHHGGVEMNRRDFLSVRWGPYLERALVIKPTFRGSLNGGMQLNWKELLRVKLIQLNKCKGTMGERMLFQIGIYHFVYIQIFCLLPNLTTLRFSVDKILELEGSYTALFLRTLARLDVEDDVRARELAQIPQERERLGAGGLFRWECPPLARS